MTECRRMRWQHMLRGEWLRRATSFSQRATTRHTRRVRRTLERRCATIAQGMGSERRHVRNVIGPAAWVCRDFADATNPEWSSPTPSWCPCCTTASSMPPVAVGVRRRILQRRQFRSILAAGAAAPRRRAPVEHRTDRLPPVRNLDPQPTVKRLSTAAPVRCPCQRSTSTSNP